MDVTSSSMRMTNALVAVTRGTVWLAREAGRSIRRMPIWANLVMRILLVVLLAFGVLEVGLRSTGWHPPKAPPHWFRATVGERHPAVLAPSPSVAHVVLPQLHTEVELLPQVLKVEPPPGKAPPPERSLWVQPPFYAFNPITAGIHNAGVEGWWMGEGMAYITINKEGFRDRDHAVAKEPGAFRIAVLGDSYAEALQVPQENTFWSVLENRLQKDCPALGHRRVEVLNFGVAGYGTTQELLVYRHFARKYRPDLVLLGFLAGNDLRDNLRSLSAAAGPMSLNRPFYVLSGKGLELDNSFLTERMSQRNWGGLRAPEAVRTVAGWLSYRSVPERSLSEVEARALVSPPDAEYAEAWEVTERVLTKLHGEASADGARFVVATVSSSEQVEPDSRRAERARARGVHDLFYWDKRLYEHARRTGFEMVPLAPAMAEIAERRAVYFHGFPGEWLGAGHWNHNGHFVAGQILADHLCRLVTVR